MTRQRLKIIGSIGVAGIYLLTLLTQLPHIYDVYSGLERHRYTVVGVSTALGAAIAFESAVALFTLRIIVNPQRERSPWTKAGVIAFLAISAVANVSYYFDVAALDAIIMPALLSVALPFALWIFAEEFGFSARAQARQTRRAQERTFSAACSLCNWSKGGYATEQAAQNALNAHTRKHK